MAQFPIVLDKAMAACAESGNEATDHFVEVNKMIDLGKGAQRKAAIVPRGFRATDKGREFVIKFFKGRV